LSGIVSGAVFVVEYSVVAGVVLSPAHGEISMVVDMTSSYESGIGLAVVDFTCDDIVLVDIIFDAIDKYYIIACKIDNSHVIDGGVNGDTTRDTREIDREIAFS
jgi:hypothetical protein